MIPQQSLCILVRHFILNDKNNTFHITYATSVDYIYNLFYHLDCL